MSCVRFKEFVSRVVAAMAALAIAFTAPIAFAQTEESEVIRMTLSEAVRRSLENNLELAIARVDPMTAREDLTISESAFDSQLTAAANNAEQVEEPSSDFSPQSTTNRNLSVGWSDPNRRGGTFSTNFEHGEVNQDFRPGAVSRFMLIEETFATSVNVSYSQSLLRNLGLAVNTASIE